MRRRLGRNTLENPQIVLYNRLHIRSRYARNTRVAKRISIINFKGGVGKTTLAFHLGTGLAWLHKARVLLIDMDHQSSLSVLCLRSAGWEAAVAQGRTVGEIFRPFTEESDSIPDNHIIIDSPMRNRDRDYDTMDIVPATLRLDDIEIQLTSILRGYNMHSEWNKRTLLCRWLEENGVDDRYDYIIFDCPPATKIVTQNAIAASHGYVIPVVPEAVMERGAPHLRNMIRTGIDARISALAQMGGEQRTMHVHDTQLVGLVITRIERASGGFTIDHREHLRSLQTIWGDALIEPYIHQGTGVSAALSDNLPVYNYPKTQNIGRRDIDIQYVDLINAVTRRIDAL